MLSQVSNRKSQILERTPQSHPGLKSRDVKLRAYQFSLAVISFVNTLPNNRAFWTLSDQLIRSATSIGANMTEGQAGSSKRDFIKFYEIALKSANETRYWLSLIKDSYPLLTKDASMLLQEATEISKMLGSSVLTLKGKSRSQI